MAARPAARVRAGGAARSDAPPAEDGRARTCVGCGERAAPEALVRLVIGPGGVIAVDAAGGGFGRGAHVHALGACIERAAKHGLARAMRGAPARIAIAIRATDPGEAPSEPAIAGAPGVKLTEEVPVTAESLGRAIAGAMERRIEGLLGAAVRSGRARLGSDAATAAWNAGDAALLVVAKDAAAAASLTAVETAVREGAAVAFGTKEALARACHARATAGIAVVAITDTRIAQAMRDATQKSMGAIELTGHRPSGSAVRTRRPGAHQRSQRTDNVERSE